VRVKISKVAKHYGIPRAFTVKINGKKYPRGNREWYFTNSKLEAINLAIIDYKVIIGKDDTLQKSIINRLQSS